MLYHELSSRNAQSSDLMGLDLEVNRLVFWNGSNQGVIVIVKMSMAIMNFLQGFRG
jgi:hypothetical protein